ncbi:MAG TPA: thioredoxin domain-containing protein [Candidatus Dormibacteraeota bacterium]|nr:thioredoxin domain-containing protein [Candidatus Dormibacteraeota bacterium]
MPNRLRDESSPYLRQHADNPVDWYPWSDEAFDQARRDDKPVLLSVGYSACHWCHVMAHESFENQDIAALMNERFVNIKVDREERPDVDTVYMQAVQAMTGHGGWPMTVFLTPDGVPFFGGTYFPPEDRMGMRGFPAVLNAVAEAYRTKREDIAAGAERTRAALQAATLNAGTVPAREHLQAAADTLLAQTDKRHGGFGAAPKFPHPMAIDLLLRRFRATGDRRYWNAAEVTLDRMERGGINDQVGGGFHRYSVDGTWSVPHFEKMLYDNAQLVPLYLHAYQLSGRDDFLRVVTATLDYMARELQLPDGGFAASQDADSEGGEGAYFVWTPAQLREVLGDSDDATVAARVFGVTDSGNFEHGATVLSIPFPLGQVATALGISESALRERVDHIRAQLLAARQLRPAPARDDKVITAWNALALKAFAESGAVLRRRDYIDIARRCAGFLLEHLVGDGVVLRAWLGGNAKVRGFLEDSAHFCDALLTLYEAEGDPRWFAAAHELALGIPERFRGDDGEYYDTANDAEQLIARPRTVDDNPVGAGPSAAANAFLRLHGFTGDDSWRQKAEAIITPLGAAVARIPLALGSLAMATELWLGPMREIAVSGRRDDAGVAELVGAVWRRFDPVRVLAWGEPDSVPLLQDRPTVGGRAAAFVCEHFVCAAPVTSVASLEALLDQTVTQRP